MAKQSMILKMVQGNYKGLETVRYVTKGAAKTNKGIIVGGVAGVRSNLDPLVQESIQKFSSLVSFLDVYNRVNADARNFKLVRDKRTGRITRKPGSSVYHFMISFGEYKDFLYVKKPEQQLDKEKIRQSLLRVIQEFVKKFFHDKGFFAYFVLHENTDNPHCHIILPKKNAETLLSIKIQKADIYEMRRELCEYFNREMEQIGCKHQLKNTTLKTLSLYQREQGKTRAYTLSKTKDKAGLLESYKIVKLQLEKDQKVGKEVDTALRNAEANPEAKSKVVEEAENFFRHVETTIVQKLQSFLKDASKARKRFADKYKIPYEKDCTDEQLANILIPPFVSQELFDNPELKEMEPEKLSQIYSEITANVIYGFNEEDTERNDVKLFIDINPKIQVRMENYLRYLVRVASHNYKLLSAEEKQDFEYLYTKDFKETDFTFRKRDIDPRDPSTFKNEVSYKDTTLKGFNNYSRRVAAKERMQKADNLRDIVSNYMRFGGSSKEVAETYSLNFRQKIKGLTSYQNFIKGRENDPLNMLDFIKMGYLKNMSSTQYEILKEKELKIHLRQQNTVLYKEDRDKVGDSTIRGFKAIRINQNHFELFKAVKPELKFIDMMVEGFYKQLKNRNNYYLELLKSISQKGLRDKVIGKAAITGKMVEIETKEPSMKGLFDPKYFYNALLLHLDNNLKMQKGEQVNDKLSNIGVKKEEIPTDLVRNTKYHVKI